MIGVEVTGIVLDWLTNCFGLIIVTVGPDNAFLLLLLLGLLKDFVGSIVLSLFPVLVLVLVLVGLVVIGT